jgi:CubicO group peptidase (beta-lactamase class C family)
MHMLAERVRIDHDVPVANYWPASGTNGKAQISVRLALNHTAGIPQVPKGCTVEDPSNWDRTCGGIAGLARVGLAVSRSRRDDADRARNSTSSPAHG